MKKLSSCCMALVFKVMCLCQGLAMKCDVALPEQILSPEEVHYSNY